MKLFLLLPLFVGSAAGIGLSAHPAHALTWNWSYAGTNVTADGTFTTTDTEINGYYTITDIIGTRNGLTITGLVPNNGLGPLYTENDNLLSVSGSLTDKGFSYYIGVTYPEINTFLDLNNYLGSGVVYYDFPDREGGERIVLFSAVIASPSPVPVPFDIPAGATIPTLGSLLGLGAIRKARKSAALKKHLVKSASSADN